MYVILRGQKWTLKFGKIRKFLGYCNHSRKIIKINKDAEGLERLDTILHECLHGCFPDIKEDTVNEIGTDMARLLWSLGYRDSNE